MMKPRRDERQLAVHGWCIAAFGDNHAHSIPQRGIRLAEEAIEAAQACGCDKDMVHRLVDHIYSKPPGDLFQEIGGVGITLLALGEASGHSADAAEKAELQRILSKPLSHFAARNDAKNAAGFNVTANTPQPPVQDARNGVAVGMVCQDNSMAVMFAGNDLPPGTQLYTSQPPQQADGGAVGEVAYVDGYKFAQLYDGVDSTLPAGTKLYAAHPPHGLVVDEAMVERAARTWCSFTDTEFDALGPNGKRTCLRHMRSALLAAIGGVK